MALSRSATNTFNMLAEFKSETHGILTPLIVDYPSEYHWLACPALTPCEDCPHHPDTHQHTLLVAIAGATAQEKPANVGMMYGQTETLSTEPLLSSMSFQNATTTFKAGVGVFIGTESVHNVSMVPNLAPGQNNTDAVELKRTATLVAAIEAVDKILFILRERVKNKAEWKLDNGELTPKRVVIKSSEAWLIEGIIDKLAVWRTNGFRITAKDLHFFPNLTNPGFTDKGGRQRAQQSSINHFLPNADLWQMLTTKLSQVEKRHNVNIVWWLIESRYNKLASSLADQAATGVGSVYPKARAEWVGEMDEAWKAWAVWDKQR